MAYFEKEELRQAKQMSAIEFLKRYRPEELVRCGTGEYALWVSACIRHWAASAA